jgi:hypothetical protein
VDARLLKIRDLIGQQEAIEAELATLMGGAAATRERAPQKCSGCGEQGHTARTCPKKSDQITP